MVTPSDSAKEAIPSMILNIPPSGYHVPNGNPEALAEKLSLLIGNPELREKLGNQAAELASKYSWKRIAKKVSKSYLRNILRSEAID